MSTGSRPFTWALSRLTYSRARVEVPTPRGPWMKRGHGSGTILRSSLRIASRPMRGGDQKILLLLGSSFHSVGGRLFVLSSVSKVVHLGDRGGTTPVASQVSADHSHLDWLIEATC